MAGQTKGKIHNIDFPCGYNDLWCCYFTRISSLQILLSSAKLFFHRSVGASSIWNQILRFSKDMKVLLADQVYIVNVLGKFSALSLEKILHKSNTSDFFFYCSISIRVLCVYIIHSSLWLLDSSHVRE